MKHKISNMVKAMKGWESKVADPIKVPKGQFGHKVTIKTGKAKMLNTELDMEFDIPFDDDVEPNEAEIIIYNLSKTTLSQIKRNEVVTVDAGYTGDTGIIFSGRISKVKTKHLGSDMQTTIYAIDSGNLKDSKVKSIAYKKGAKASYILKDLIGRLKVPVAVFKVRREHIYKEKTNVEGSIIDAIKKYSEVCGVSTYCCKGKIYSRWIKDGDNINFTVNESTGLIESPEEFEQEISTDGAKEVIKGFRVKMLLQHRITTAVIITLKSVDVKGKYRVRSGSHSYDGNNFYTEVEVI